MSQFQARFFDGRSAAEQRVGVAVEAAGVRLFGASGETQADWPFADMQQVAGAAPPPLRISLRSLPDARLVIEDAAAIAAITPKLPRRKDDPTLRVFLIGGFATAVVVASLWFLTPVATRIAVSLVPTSLEEKWGEKVGAELLSQSSRCEAEDGARALARIVSRLTDSSPLTQGRRLEVMVVKDAMVNAFALPGGRIVIMEGLLQQAKSADEVAGVLAHEMGHVIARHAVEKMIWREAVSFGAALLMGEGYGVSLAQFLVNQSHSRDAEREADRLAVNLLNQAAVSTEGFAAFFERQAAALNLPGAGLLGYLSSHPPDPERKAAAMTARTAQAKPALSDEEWRAVQNICTVRKQT